MEENMPESVTPMDYRLQFDAAKLYAELGDKNSFDRLSPKVEKSALEELKKNPGNTQSYYNPYRILLDIYNTRGDYRSELDIMTKLDQVMPGRPEIKKKIDILEARINGVDSEKVPIENDENNEP
jgi:hypothetical protein